jgi:hypothetical protein
LTKETIDLCEQQSVGIYSVSLRPHPDSAATPLSNYHVHLIGGDCKQPRANNYHNMFMLMVSSTMSLSSILFLFSLSSSRPRGCNCKQPRANNYHTITC